MISHSHIPTFMPHLQAGAHRSPRRGACFMEFASYLAGERWSDHPECTDPVLAAFAREINDRVADSRRDALVGHVPRVVGLRGDDGVIGLVVALRAATEALPVASMDRQRALALGIQGLRRVLADAPVDVRALDQLAEAALRDVPDARAWADAYLAAQRPGSGPLHASATYAIVRVAAAGIAEACIDDPDGKLMRTLELTIGEVERLVAQPARARELVTA